MEASRMIQSFLLSDSEARLELVLQGTNGLEAKLSAVIDTGFTEMLTLSREWISALQLEFSSDEFVILADGSSIHTEIYIGVILWDGTKRSIFIHCMEGDALVGMGLMKDFLLHLPVRIGAEFTISEIE